MDKINLKSSVNDVGKVVTQIIHFKDGVKRTINNIVSETIKQGEFTKMYDVHGRLFMINDSNVLMIEVFDEDSNLPDSIFKPASVDMISKDIEAHLGENLWFLQRLKLLKNLKVVDIVEVNPDLDFNNQTVKVAAKLIRELI